MFTERLYYYKDMFAPLYMKEEQETNIFYIMITNRVLFAVVFLHA